MKLTVKIKCDNAAFEDDAGGECARILRRVAQLLEDGYTSGPLQDANGNTVGSWGLE